MRRRRRFSAEFKEVALEAIKGHETVCGAGDQARTASDPDCSLEARGDREAGQGVRKVNMTISLAFLAPDLVKAAIDGRLPHGMGVARLCDLPVEWSRQRQMLGLIAQ